jgi:hypothetical protein
VRALDRLVEFVKGRRDSEGIPGDFLEFEKGAAASRSNAA